jgi:hypothetical protein
MRNAPPYLKLSDFLCQNASVLYSRRKIPQKALVPPSYSAENSKKESLLWNQIYFYMRREDKPGGLLESVLVDPTGRDFKGPGQALKVLSSRLRGSI